MQTNLSKAAFKTYLTELHHHPPQFCPHLLPINQQKVCMQFLQDYKITLQFKNAVHIQDKENCGGEYMFSFMKTIFTFPYYNILSKIL